MGGLSSRDEHWEDVLENFYGSEAEPEESATWDRLFKKNADKEEQKMKPKKKKTKVKVKKEPKHSRGQTKLPSFFATKTNDDGYPMHHCKFHPELQRHVYIPPDYGCEKHHLRKPDLFGRFCYHCMLSPCVAEHYHYEAFEFSVKMAKSSKYKTLKSVVRRETELFLQKKHCKLFKKRFSKKREVLKCIRNHVAEVIPVYGKDDNDSSTEEDTDEDTDESDEEDIMVSRNRRVSIVLPAEEMSENDEDDSSATEDD